VLLGQGGEVVAAFDECVWCTQGSAAAWVRNSGFTTDERGFLRVNTHLQSTNTPDVFGGGDIVSIEVGAVGEIAFLKLATLSYFLALSVTHFSVNRRCPSLCSLPPTCVFLQRIHNDINDYLIESALDSLSTATTTMAINHPHHHHHHNHHRHHNE
jgi:hypothetical protein